MLTSFSISNFRSINDLTVSLAFAEKRAPVNYKESEYAAFYEPMPKCRIVPVLAIFGSNASGKSNFLMALNTFRNCAVSGISGQFHPNKLKNDLKKTLFSIECIIGKAYYRYSFEYSRDSILKEKLEVNRKVLFCVDEQIHFVGLATKAYTNDRLQEILRVEATDAQGNQIRSFLSVLGNHYPGLNSYVSALYEYLFHELMIFRHNDVPISRGVDMLARVLSKTDEQDPLKVAFEQITELLRKLDIHIARMALNRKRLLIDQDINDRNYIDVKPEVIPRLTSFEKEGENIIVNADRIRTFHEDEDGNEIEFDFLEEESSGTQIVAGLLGVFLAALKTGGIVVIDELDRSLHPLLLVEMVRLFKDKRYNEKGAQLIFSVHNTDVLEGQLLRVSEVAIVNNRGKQGTHISRLSDFEGVSTIETYRRQYLSGRFEGIPFPYI